MDNLRKILPHITRGAQHMVTGYGVIDLCIHQ